MVKVVGVRFKKAGKIYYFDPKNIYLKVGDYVIVETSRGLEYGQVVVGIKYVSNDEIVAPIKPVIRKATYKDHKTYEKNKQKEEKALEICREKVEKHGLQMKLIDVEYTFDNNKVIFYFTAEGRIDFRDLVKDLASVFKIRIELRQIGVRDEAKMLGGLGPCGIPLCCSKWLGEFEPVSIKMAKEQNLSLNPSKISGICGRLLCCLKYEQDLYEEARLKLPKVGQRIKTEKGFGEILKVNVLPETILVKLEGDDAIIEQYNISEVKIINSCCKSYKNKKNNEKELKNLNKKEIEELKKLEN